MSRQAPLPCVAGVDGGGTKTVCHVADLAGAPLGRATGGASNYQSVGAAAMRRVLWEVVEGAARAAGRPLEVRGLCLALAGVDRPADRTAVEEAVAAMASGGGAGGALSWALPPAGAVIVNDAVAALVGGTGRKLGVVVIAGTGSIAFGMNAAGEQRRAGGWGHLLGDEGSAYAIGLAALRAVCRAADGRGPRTGMADRLLAAHGLSLPSDLIAKAYGEWKVPDIAALAPLVVAEAGAGDAVAGAVLDAAGDDLAAAGCAVLRALGLVDEAVDVVTAGGLWPGAGRVRERFTAALRRAGARAQVVWPQQEPVAGAVLLARESAGAIDLG